VEKLAEYVLASDLRERAGAQAVVYGTRGALAMMETIPRPVLGYNSLEVMDDLLPCRGGCSRGGEGPACGRPGCTG
jgi:hypothetical protein